MPQMTAYRQQALAVANALARTPSRPRDLRILAPDAAKIVQGNVYGWFERIERGLYGLTSVWSRRPRNMGQSCFRRGERLGLAAPLLRRRIACRSKKGLAFGRKRSMCMDVRIRRGAAEEPFAPTIAAIRGSRQ